MAEQIEFDPFVEPVQAQPELTVVRNELSPEIFHMFMLLADGNAGVIDYRGGQRRYYKVDPTVAARAAIHAVE
ncbi:MAG: hypothetical protein WC498_03330 [Candidatus Saccharimonadales bacterium]